MFYDMASEHIMPWILDACRQAVRMHWSVTGVHPAMRSEILICTLNARQCGFEVHPWPEDPFAQCLPQS